MQTGEDSSANLFTLSYVYSNTLMERTERDRGTGILCMSLKQAPKGKQSRLYISSYSGKRLGLHLSCLKMQVSLPAKERCSTISEDPEPRSEQTTENCTHRGAHVHFISQSIFILHDKKLTFPAKANKPTVNWNLYSILSVSVVFSSARYRTDSCKGESGLRFWKFSVSRTIRPHLFHS